MCSPYHVDGLKSSTRLLAHHGHGKGVSITAKFQNVDHHKIYDTYITFDMYNLGTPRRRMHFKKLATTRTPLPPFFYGRSVTTDHLCFRHLGEPGGKGLACQSARADSVSSRRLTLCESLEDWPASGYTLSLHCALTRQASY
jgi:hypothetical protein